MDTIKECLSRALPLTDELPYAALARGKIGCDFDGFAPRDLLPRLLLAVDVAVVRAWRYESAMGSRTNINSTSRKDNASWRDIKPGPWDSFNRLGFLAYCCRIRRSSIDF